MTTKHQVKIKISMNCFSKEDEIKTKLVQGQWLQLKATFLFFLSGWLGFWWGGEADGQISGWWGRETLPPSCLHQFIFLNIYIYIYIYIKELCQQVFIYNEEAPCTAHASCAKVAILLLQDLSTLCLTDIYGICFHVSVQLQ